MTILTTNQIHKYMMQKVDELSKKFIKELDEINKRIETYERNRIKQVTIHNHSEHALFMTITKDKKKQSATVHVYGLGQKQPKSITNKKILDTGMMVNDDKLDINITPSTEKETAKKRR